MIIVALLFCSRLLFCMCMIYGCSWIYKHTFKGPLDVSNTFCISWVESEVFVFTVWYSMLIICWTILSSHLVMVNNLSNLLLDLACECFLEDLLSRVHQRHHPEILSLCLCQLLSQGNASSTAYTWNNSFLNFMESFKKS